MLTWFFLSRFIGFFSLFLTVLTLLFGFCDAGIRLALLPSFSLFAHFFVLMLPLMILFSLPLASTLAVQQVVGALFIDEEIITLSFWKRARSALHRAVLIFSCLVAGLFVPLSWYLVPQSYWSGKLFLIQATQQHIDSLPENVFHTVIPGFTFFFKEKQYTAHETRFHHLIMMIRDKKQIEYLITAQEGCITQGVLTLRNGALFRQQSPYFSHARFASMQLSLARIFEKQDGPAPSRPLKFQTMTDLVSNRSQAQPWTEGHKRRAQLVWQILLPWCALWLIKIRARRKSNLLLMLVLSGLLFLVYYTCTSLVGAIATYPLLVLTMLYAPLLVAPGLYYYYKKTW